MTGVWLWIMPSGKIYRVMTNPIDGTIKVYDPSGKLTRSEENLTEAAVKTLEKNFLAVVATRVKVKVKGEEPEMEITDDTAWYIR
ncbi:MAG: hypothetical protein WAV32_06265 [Halobacteriota archaeon]